MAIEYRSSQPSLNCHHSSYYVIGNKCYTISIQYSTISEGTTAIDGDTVNPDGRNISYTSQPESGSVEVEMRH